jgi:hypothetical protein
VQATGFSIKKRLLTVKIMFIRETPELGREKPRSPIFTPLSKLVQHWLCSEGRPSLITSCCFTLAPDGTYPNGVRDVFKQLVSFMIL